VQIGAAGIAMDYANCGSIFLYRHKKYEEVRLRPWAEMGGCIATNATTFNRELLIVEKSNDGKPFELHTSYAEEAITFFTHTAPPIISLAMLTSSFSLASSFSAISFPCAVEEKTNGRLSLGAGTLYGALNSLQDKKWIEPYGYGYCNKYITNRNIRQADS